jgi:hypothetical protein
MPRVAIFKRKHAEIALDPEDRAPTTGIKYKDLALLGQLLQAGADLAEPRHALYFLYLPSEQIANEAADAARNAGFRVTVREPLEGDDQWSAVCEVDDAVLSPDFVRTTTDFFDDLAGSLGGVCDGWEAAV